ncbi:DUF1254 domain-containing protein [Streptomyces sp. HB2AG]|uniref:DUF1254 domain-containing protein n=1 Tax=Streptomyces sp. HB2AG TaxID=2983400 RepID=UPI0022AA1C0C|nr:DUF1254 domain-containing protein [Streptomyces sp. HB2AG]MCZ2523635.1 DUF1254 domain-containing protein [Streptomyces sp. HB2AG]
MAQSARVPQRTVDSVSTPERVETRLGTLEFPLGVPTEETQRRIHDHLDHVHALNAFLNAYRGVSTWATRRAFLAAGVEDNDVLLFSGLMDAASLLLTANADTVYFVSFLDLTRGPLVVDFPPATLCFVNDMWFRWVTDVGTVGPDRGAGGRYLFVPPGYDGPLPEGGVFVRHSRTTRLLLGGRAFLEDGDPGPAVERIGRGLRIRPYAAGGYGTSIGSVLGGGPAPTPPWTPQTWAAALEQSAPPRFVEGSGLALNTVPPVDGTYFDMASELVQDQPAEALDPEVSGDLAAIGIVRGQPFRPDARMRGILAEAAAVGNAAARTLSFRPRPGSGAYYYGEGSQWTNGLFAYGHEFMTPSPRITDEGVEPYPGDGARRLDLQAWYFYSVTGISPALAMRLTGLGSQYLFAFADREGRPLDGGKHYRVTLPPDVPAARFWSLTVYDNQTRSMLDTPQRFPRAGSQASPTPAAVPGPDGTVTVHFCPDRPDGVPEGNWIRTVPGRGWFVALRLYSPLQPFFDKTWRPGEIEEAGRSGNGAG